MPAYCLDEIPSDPEMPVTILELFSLETIDKDCSPHYN